MKSAELYSSKSTQFVSVTTACCSARTRVSAEAPSHVQSAAVMFKRTRRCVCMCVMILSGSAALTLITGGHLFPARVLMSQANPCCGVSYCGQEQQTHRSRYVCRRRRRQASVHMFITTVRTLLCKSLEPPFTSASAEISSKYDCVLKKQVFHRSLRHWAALSL